MKYFNAINVEDIKLDDENFLINKRTKLTLTKDENGKYLLWHHKGIYSISKDQFKKFKIID